MCPGGSLSHLQPQWYRKSFQYMMLNDVTVRLLSEAVQDYLPIALPDVCFAAFP